MALPILDRLIDKSKEEPEYFLALEINATRVKSAAWVVVSGQTEVVATGSTSYWSGKEFDELVKAVDDSLARLAQKLSLITKSEPSKVIFGLPAQWVGQDSKILADRAAHLKELSKKLELSPMGFVVTSEALVQYLKDQEGIPPSVICVELEEEEIEVTLIHLGKVIGRTRVARSVDLGADLEEGLTRFMPQAILPSRILLFDGRAVLEDARQQLLNHPWRSKGIKLPFLHFPKVEILSEEETVKAVAVAGGAEAAKAIGLPIIEKEELPPQTAPSEVPDEVQEKLPEGEEAAAKEVAEETTRTEEISEDEKEIKLEVPLETEKFGFVEGSDIQKVRPQPIASPKAVTTSTLPPASPSVSAKKFPTFSAILSLPDRLLTPIKLRFSSLKVGLPAIRGAKILIIFLGSLVFAFAIAAIAWWNFASAAVTIEVQAKTLHKDTVLVIDPATAEVDSAKGIIPGKVFQGEASSQKSIPTTGQKLVGTKATGTILIYNNTSQPVILKNATTLTSETGLKVTTNGAVIIASSSGTAASPTPGQASTTATAADVGPEYNLADGTSFSAPGYSTIQVVGKSQGAFAGGDKRQVQAVSKDDRDKLLDLVTSELTPKAKEDLIGKIPDDYQLVTGSISFKTALSTFDKKQDDEATSLTLSQTIRASGIAIPKTSLETYLVDLVNENFSDQFQPDFSGSTVDFSQNKTATGAAVKVTAGITLIATPKIDIDSVKNGLMGKSREEADAILSHTPGFVRQEITLLPDLPGPFSVLPHKPQRISVNVKTTTFTP
jgi:hypothetical protein